MEKFSQTFGFLKCIISPAAKAFWLRHQFGMSVKWTHFWSVFKDDFKQNDMDEQEFKTVLVHEDEVLVKKWDQVSQKATKDAHLPGVIKEAARRKNRDDLIVQYQTRITELERQLIQMKMECKQMEAMTDTIAPALRAAVVENAGPCKYIINTGVFHGDIGDKFTLTYHTEFLQIHFPWTITTSMLLVRLWDNDGRKYDWESDSSVDGEKWEPLFKRTGDQGLLTIAWSPRPMRHLRFKGTNDVNTNLHIVRFELFNVGSHPDLYSK